MKGDFSKLRFDAKKHYHDVLMQQGRVMLDSDWNEQAAIEAYRTEAGTLDIIGNSGAPMHNAGFRLLPSDNSGNPVVNGKNLKIFKGRLYVDGILCENEADVLFSAQPDYAEMPLPAPPLPSSPPGAVATYLFYLDVWQRHITVLEDASIREVALGGPDTTTRSKIIWQVKYADTKTMTSGINCLTNLPADILPLSTGLLSARPEQAAVATDPCGLTASGGYRRLENQLYRVEVHTGGATRAASRFKWSRDNGSVAVKWESVESADPNKLIVSSAGRDELLGFKSGNWIELIDDTTDLLGKPGVMVQLSKVDGNVLTINPATIKDSSNASATTVVRSTNNPRIRRWDSDGILQMNSTNIAWVKLEDGVEVKFAEGIYKTGDYWLIPARTAIADVEWPKDSANQPLSLPPHGILHHFCKLAILDVDSTGQWTLKSDCRPVFPPITELTNLYYVGGDGQEAMPGNKLPATLKVGVANGQWAVAGAKIKFEVSPGGGTLNQTTAITNAQGIAECEWTLATNVADLLLQVKASLLDAANNVMPQQLPIIFNASFSIAQDVFYQPTCTNWAGTPPDTVAKALDQLCERKSESSTGCSYTIGPKGDFKNLPEAITVLIKKKEKDVSLCFMPGEHIIEEDILMLQKVMRFDILKISGYAARITMKVKRIELVAEKLIMTGLNLASVGADTGAENNAQILLFAAETLMDYCSLARNGQSGAPFVIIRKEGLVYLTNNKIFAFPSLVLANGVQGIIEKNIIESILLQNLEIDPFKPVPLGWPNADIKKAIRNSLIGNSPDEVKITDWSLTIRGNRIGLMMTDVNRPKPQDLYQNMIISENIFQFPLNSFGAKYTSMINNQFLFEQTEQAQAVLAYVLGFFIVIMGNSNRFSGGHTPGFLQTGALDVIALLSIKGDGVGSNQLLNLVNVITT